MCVAMTAPAAAATAAGGVLGGIGLSKYMRSRNSRNNTFAEEPSGFNRGSGFRRGASLKDPKKLLIPLK
jgi:hypothetical protein